MTDTNAAIAVYDIKAGQYLVAVHGPPQRPGKPETFLSKLKPIHLADHVLEPDLQPATR